MPQIGPLEILLVAVIALIVFGPDKLPEMARTVGRTLQELRRQADALRSEFQAGLEEEDQPAKTPAEAPATAGDEGSTEAPADAPATVGDEGSTKAPAEAPATAGDEPEVAPADPAEDP